MRIMKFDSPLLSLLLAFLFVAFTQPVHAQNKLGATELNVPATLVAESRQVQAGQSVTLAFVMEPKPTWHGYWENPGDAGIGMSFDWDLPAGVTAGKPQFPVPDTLMIAGIMNYIYKGDFAVLVNLVVSENTPIGELPISVKSEWLACTDEICVPEQDELSITLAVVGKECSRFTGQPLQCLIAKPCPGRSAARQASQSSNDIFRLSVPLPANIDVEQPYFFIKEDGIVDYAAKQKVNRDGDALIIETARARRQSG